MSADRTSNRIRRLREALVNTPPSVCADRAIHTTAAYRTYGAEQVDVLRARVLEAVLQGMAIFIEPGTLLVGNQASKNRAAPIFPEYAMDWVVAELDDYERRPGDVFTITEQVKTQLREIAPYWAQNTLKERGLRAFPPDCRKVYDLGIIKTEGNITSGDGHLAVNYQEVLREGLLGTLARAKKEQVALDLCVFADLKKNYFYQGVEIALQGVIAFSHRFAALAKTMADKERDPQRRAELLEIARVTEKVPAHPAESFYEAVQSLWMCHLVLQIESNGHSVSFGRLDQYLYPYYQRELEAGTLTEEGALELLENLWLKTFSINKLRPWSHTRFSAGSPLYQNVTVGGSTLTGESAVNPLSHLVLESVGAMRLPQPNLTVRYCKALEPDFLEHCLQIVRLGFGMPAFNNDESIIPSFVKRGVAPEDAANYSAIGCVEVAVPGKWGYRCTGMSFLNFPKILLIAMNNGVDPQSGEQVAQGQGHFKEMTSFAQLFAAWDRTIRAFARKAQILDTCADMVLEQTVPDIFCSALTADCIGRGKTIKEGGAVYDFISDLQVGIANLGDSLCAIRQCVFEEKSMTPGALWTALCENFAGVRGAEIRTLLLRAPKYGNDIDAVDDLTRQGYASYLSEMHNFRNTRYGRGPIGGVYYGGTSSISANVPQGAGTLATPDGRLAGEPLAEGCSPTHGADVCGPTAVMKSVSKLPTEEILGGVLLNQKTTPQLLSEAADRQKLLLALRSFFDRLKGFHIQFNVVDRETLLDAQVNPEKHKDLIVRVAGYSAFFGVLSKETQDDIIARTEQTY